MRDRTRKSECVTEEEDGKEEIKRRDRREALIGSRSK